MSEVLEIDEAVVNSIAQKVTASLELPTVDSIATAVSEKMEAERVANEATAKKDIHDNTEAKKTAFGELSKEARFARGLVAFKNGNANGIAEYNEFVNKAWQDQSIEKANYQNVTTTADGGALVPDPEFVAEVERLTSDYGIAARLADVRLTDRDSVTLLAGTNTIAFTKTGEATAQNAQKLTYSATTVALEKYIATLVMTSEVVEDAAINLWNDAANEIARARALLFDQLVFTDSTYGLLSPTIAKAYKTQTVGAAITDFDADDAMNSQYKVASSVRRASRFFMHPTVFNQLRQSKASTGGEYLFGPVGSEVTPMINGVPVELVDVMPAVGEIGANKAFAVFGDLSRVKLHVKRVLETKIFDSGVVKDAGGSDINLITQDSWAIRATLRVVPQTRFNAAFCIIGTGTVS